MQSNKGCGSAYSINALHYIKEIFSTLKLTYNKNDARTKLQICANMQSVTSIIM